MIVFRSTSHCVDVEPAFRQGLLLRGDDRLIRLGELEAGVADALCPERDAHPPELRRIRALIEAAAAVPCEPDDKLLEGSGLKAGISTLLRGLPAVVHVGIPEGYAFYALYPEQYRIAARRYFEELRPDRVVAIGIRSIGTSLSAVVAAELLSFGCQVWSCTVRPRGHPFDRYLALAEDLELELQSRSAWHFAIVDEGPGLSGSSFCSVARALREIGVPDERIVFFPSWDAPGSEFRSEFARRRWPRHRRYVAAFEDTATAKRFAGAQDLSAGCWRQLSGTPEIPVQPQHERRKYLAGGTWYKFAGLGKFGAGKLQFSSRFTPALEGLEAGFLRMERIEGNPVSAAGPALLDTIAGYLDWRAQSFPSSDGASWDELMEMIEVNAREGIDGGSVGFLRGFRAGVESAPRVAVDGRMLPHEWLDCSSRYVKTDATDHHADHFFPGCQNIAWDVAGAALEFDLPREAAARLYPAAEPLLPFYLTAYAAFRLGYATMAAETLGESPDGLRFRGLASRYSRQVKALVQSAGTRWQ